MKKELIFGALFALLILISIMQTATVMSMNEKLESSVTGEIVSSQNTETREPAQSQSAQRNTPQAGGSSRSLSDLAGMVGGC